MTTKNKIIIGIVAVVIVVLGYMYFHKSGNQIVGAANQCASGQTCLTSLELTGATGGATNSLQIDAGISAIGGASSFTSTVQIGSSGTLLNNVIAGNCFLHPYATTIAATTTASVDCEAGTSATVMSPLAGVQFGDKVNAMFSTTTAGTTVGGLELIGASASTTPGYIQMTVVNNTGGTYTWASNVTATTSPVSYTDYR